jgi:hypothetical protein
MTDHNPVARTNIVELEDAGRVCDDGRQLGVGPGDIALHQRRVVRALARERLDDVADPVRKLSQDLVRFVSCCRLIHVRLAASIHSCKCTESVLTQPRSAALVVIALVS